MTDFKFIKTLFTTMLATLIILTCFVCLIDPYDKLHINLFHFKTKAVAFPRENKFILLENAKKNYEAFIIGSSVGQQYFTGEVKKLTGYNAFNYTVHTGSPDDEILITKHILDKTQPKLIILTLNFIELNENYPIDNQLSDSSLMKYAQKEVSHEKPLFDNNYFTLKAINDALRVVYVNYTGKTIHNYTEDGDMIYKIPEKNKPIRVWIDSINHYKFSKRRLDELKEIQNLCNKNKVRLVVIINPIAKEYLDYIEENKIFKQIHREYKEKVASLFDEVYDFQNKSILPYSNSENFFDSVHPTREFSTIILNVVFKSVPLGLGVRLKRTSPNSPL